MEARRAFVEKGVVVPDGKSQRGGLALVALELGGGRVGHDAAEAASVGDAASGGDAEGRGVIGAVEADLAVEQLAGWTVEVANGGGYGELAAVASAGVVRESEDRELADDQQNDGAFGHGGDGGGKRG